MERTEKERINSAKKMIRELILGAKAHESSHLVADVLIRTAWDALDESKNLVPKRLIDCVHNDSPSYKKRWISEHEAIWYMCDQCYEEIA